MSSVPKQDDAGRQLKLYDPEKGLKTIVVAEAGEKHFRRTLRQTKDPLARDQLIKAIETKIDAQVEYVVWRDAVARPAHRPKKSFSSETVLPDADPGDLVAHRWRKRFCLKQDRQTLADAEKIAQAKADAELRCQRICEQQNMGTVRGTEGTGEFERYTPAEYIEAVRDVLGVIDLDPATSAIAQKTVKAAAFFTVADNGLERDWCGKVFLNPPYHRELAPRFIDKLIEEIVVGHVTEAILLTNNCTDTEWFLRAAMMSKAICFTCGRIKFTQPNGSEVLPTQGQAFFYFGSNVARFGSVFGKIGFGVVPRWECVA